MVGHRSPRSLAGMNIPIGYTMVQVDPDTASDAELEQGARLQQIIANERVPEDPLTPIEVYMQRARAKTPNQWRAYFSARDSTGAHVGYAFVGRNLNEPENAHVRWCEVGVHPDHRRRGLGRALLRAVVQACEGTGDDLLFISQTNSRVAAADAFSKAIGASAALPMKMNQLTLADVDRASVAEWAKIDPQGYRLERADDVVPQALLQPYLGAVNAMNDMPKGELRVSDQRFTAEQIHDRESWLKQAGMRWWAIVAIDEATGQGAGFTEVQYDPRVPHVIWQGGTGVVAAHRGHKLGLWMKAVMLERILRERPTAKYVRTGNANVNEQMLAINTQLGFVHAWSQTLWQLPLAEARTSLALRETARA